MDTLNLVAFCGAAGHGKDTAARSLIDYHGYTRVNFADALKHHVSTIFDIGYGDLETQEGKRKVHAPSGLTHREILQKVGVSMRDVWPDVWVHNWAEMAKEEAAVVCTDCRFQNEFDAIKELGGLVVRIINPRLPLPVEGVDHVSETEHLKFAYDAVLYNDDTINYLTAQVRGVVPKLLPVGRFLIEGAKH